MDSLVTKVLPDIIKGYEPHNILNAIETGLYSTQADTAQLASHAEGSVRLCGAIHDHQLLQYGQLCEGDG